MATKVEFIDLTRVRVEAENGDVYILGHDSSMNYQIDQQWDKFYSHCLSELFDKYYDGNEQTLWGPIARGLFKNRLDMFDWVMPDRDKERIRIGNKIKELRKNSNMDAKDLAQKIGIDPGNLSRIEQGKFGVGIDTLNRIAGVFNMIVDFIPNDVQEQSNDSTINEL